MRAWRPSTIAKSTVAVFAGACAAWSWMHGEVWNGVGAFVIALLLSTFGQASEETIEKQS